jgi:hypothetical protein
MNELNAIEGAEPKKSYKAVFTVVERNGRKFWVRLGTAFPNRDSSWNIYLDASPTNGQLQMRDPEPRRSSADHATDSLPGMGDAS